MLISPTPNPILTLNFKLYSIQVSFNLFCISNAFYNAILQTVLNSSCTSTTSVLLDGGHTTIIASNYSDNDYLQQILEYHHLI